MKGMTGFSYISEMSEYGKVSVYLKTLNSRFLELRVLLPPSLQSLESQIRKMLKDNFRRGRVELIVDFYPKGVGFEVSVNEELAKSYFLSLKKLSNYLGLLPDIEIVDIANMPNVVNLVNSDISPSFSKQVKTLVMKAIKDVVRQRIKEGEQTKRNIIDIVNEVKKEIENISLRWIEVNKLVEEKVKEKVEKFLKDYENRKEIDTAIVSFLLKVDINEEIFRFKKHIEDLENLLNSDGEVGKKFEFILQELNREANTISSKSFDYVISSSVIEIKTSLEKIREHIQNVE